MINMKVLSTAAAVALMLALPTASFAGGRGGFAGGGGGGFHGGGFHGGGAMGGGGGFRGGAPAMAGGAGFRSGGVAAAGPRFVGGGAAVAGPRFVGGAPAGGARFAGNGNWQGGHGNWQGRHHRHGGFWPGVAVGAAIGGSYAYYGGPGYYDNDYYDDSYYYDESAPVAAAPVEGGDDSYCRQTYRSYDPASGTYLGNDGRRHPCP